MLLKTNAEYRVLYPIVYPSFDGQTLLLLLLLLRIDAIAIAVVLSFGVPVVQHILLCWPDIQCETDSSN